MGSEEWLGPEVESILIELLRQKVREILMIPIGFVSDHIEVLYDIDILYRGKSESMGMILKRTNSLNFSGRFIEALSSIVEKHIRGSQGSRIQGV